MTKTELFPHQKIAFEKLKNIKVNALFMDMGVGKTRTIIEFIKYRWEKISKVIYCCPVSLKINTKCEFEKHFNYKNIILFDNKINENNIPSSKIYIIGIESISMSDRVFLALNKLIDKNIFFIVDESHMIKTHNSIRSKRLTFLAKKAKYRTIMTGTPISNGIQDLYSQFKFLSSLILGFNSWYGFSANHLVYSEKYPGLILRALREEEIAYKIAPYVYQIKKEECIKLPEKVYNCKYFDINDEQRFYYQKAKEDILQLDINEFDKFTIFRLFNALQQIVNGFWNKTIFNGKKFVLDTFYNFENPRIDLLKDTILSINKKHKIIIWVKYNYDIKQIEKMFKRLDVKRESYCLYYGKLDEKKRNDEIKKFKSDTRYLIATQACGGYGLTLNEAEYSIFYNNSFKYALRDQSECRNYRIGQDKKVIYIDLVARDTIDDRIQRALTKKENIVNSFKKEVDKIKNKFKGKKSKEKLKELIINL